MRITIPARTAEGVDLVDEVLSLLGTVQIALGNPSEIDETALLRIRDAISEVVSKIEPLRAVLDQLEAAP